MSSGNAVHNLPLWVFGLIVGVSLAGLLAGYLAIQAIRRRASNARVVSDIESQSPTQPIDPTKSVSLGSDEDTQLAGPPLALVLSSHGLSKMATHSADIQLAYSISQPGGANMELNLDSDASMLPSSPASWNLCQEAPSTPSLLSGDHYNTSMESVDTAEVPHLYISQCLSMKAIVAECALDTAHLDAYSTSSVSSIRGDLCEPPVSTDYEPKDSNLAIHNPASLDSTYHAPSLIPVTTSVFRFCGNSLVQQVSPSHWETGRGLSRFLDVPFVEEASLPVALDRPQEDLLLPSFVFRDL